MDCCSDLGLGLAALSSTLFLFYVYEGLPVLSLHVFQACLVLMMWTRLASVGRPASYLCFSWCWGDRHKPPHSVIMFILNMEKLRQKEQNQSRRCLSTLRADRELSYLWLTGTSAEVLKGGSEGSGGSAGCYPPPSCPPEAC